MQETYHHNTLINALYSNLLFGIIRTKMKYTFKDFQAEYPDDAACLRSVLENRFGDTCPRCGVVGVKFYPITGRKGFKCSECAHHIYPLADTIFRKSETSLYNWFRAIFMFSTHKNGVSAKLLERELGVTYKTAWRMCRQIRKLMEQDAEMLSGTIEADETYIGGPRKLKVKYSNKTAVIGIVEKGGRAKAFTAKHADATNTLPFLRANIAPGSMLHTDDSRIYSRVRRDFDHEFVNHSKQEYVRAGVTTNTIEGFWGNWKSSMTGTYRSVSPKYLNQYLNEFVFRYNYRTIPVFPVLLEQVVKHV